MKSWPEPQFPPNPVDPPPGHYVQTDGKGTYGGGARPMRPPAAARRFFITPLFHKPLNTPELPKRFVLFTIPGSPFIGAPTLTMPPQLSVSVPSPAQQTRWTDEGYQAQSRGSYVTGEYRESAAPAQLPPNRDRRRQ